MKIVTCPHCGGRVPGSLFSSKLGSIVTEAKIRAARENGKLGGSKPIANPVRLRPYHPQHPKHQEWLAEQQRKKSDRPTA